MRKILFAYYYGFYSVPEFYHIHTFNALILMYHSIYSLNTYVRRTYYVSLFVDNQNIYIPNVYTVHWTWPIVFGHVDSFSLWVLVCSLCACMFTYLTLTVRILLSNVCIQFNSMGFIPNCAFNMSAKILLLFQIQRHLPHTYTYIHIHIQTPTWLSITEEKKKKRIINWYRKDIITIIHI